MTDRSSPPSDAARVDVALSRWVEQAVGNGWLDAGATDALGHLHEDGAADLFDSRDRPLVAGLFGGTGVGKSSLLNRLAGQQIARASAERPTSRAVTAYLHRSRSLDALPAEFPLAKLHTAHHHEERWRNVLWVDMPDIDSVETSHADQVDAWLPHLDVVLYVASPERYRDDRGWRLLAEHAGEHAWLFVMNHWDRADPRQLDDWRTQLAAAGFADPMLFRTVSLSECPDRIEDDFTSLVGTLSELTDRHLIEALERHGTLARLTRLLDTVDTLEQESIGQAPGDQALDARWNAHWRVAREGIAGALRARIPALVARSREAGDGSAQGSVASQLLDAASIARMRDALTRFLQDSAARGALPRKVARRVVEPQASEALETLVDRVDGAIGGAMAKPGTRWQRTLHRGATILATVLPLAALGWAGWRVFDAFRRGGNDPAAYLGSPFAITAALLVALAWGLPWLVARRSLPSLSDSLAQGLTDGIDAALDAVHDAVLQGLVGADAERLALAVQLQQTRQLAVTRLQPLHGNGDVHQRLPDALRRLLAAPVTGDATDATVRATTHTLTDATPLS